MDKKVEKIIYNCHTHIFTYKSLPSGFVPFGLEKVLKFKWIQKRIIKLSEGLNPLSKTDIVQRLGRVAKASFKEHEVDVFENLLSYYPSNSKFVVLPMDMDFMGRDKMPQSIIEQHDELLQIKSNPKYTDRVIPFVHFDPRREAPQSAIGLIKKYISLGFGGIKLYPNLGYSPNDPLLKPIWKYANKKQLPVMVHCSRGGVYKKDSTKEEKEAWSHPLGYKNVLEKYPNMKLCLGHFGGNNDWDEYLQSNAKDTDNWLYSIKKMITDGNYKNLYTDISYSVFNFRQNAKILKVLLTDETLLNHTLFGSDFYMAEQEEFSEKKLSMYLRAELGEEVFWKIANENPKKFLFEKTEIAKD